jgi:RHS repeat-associated protein
VSWTGFNHVASLTYKGATTDFKHDHSHRRIQETVTQGTTVRNVYFVHPSNAGGLSFEREEIKTGGVVTRDESRHYISVGGSVVAVVKTLAGAGVVSTDANLTQYWHKDGLGSVVSVSNAGGVVQERMAFDPWGRRVRSSGMPDAGVNPSHGDRGFTGHEHLDEQGLIHMNGRVHNPLLGRFLSADPYIQDANNLQNYNRYSYVLNNPLRYTDPSGEIIEWYLAAAYVVGAVLARNGNEYWSFVGQATMFFSGAALGGTCPVCGGWGAAAAGGSGAATAGIFALGAIGGYAAPGATGGDAILGGLSALAFMAIGQELADGVGFADVVDRAPQRMLAHALMGCVRGMASGGSCGPSAAAAFVSKGVTEGVSAGGGNAWVNGIASTVAGGTISYMGGGKFANGAITAGYQYVFNQAMAQGARAAAGGSAGGSGTRAAGAALAAALTTAADEAPEKIWVTYTKVGPNGEVYAGRTSGYGTPEEVVAARDRGHIILNLIQGFSAARVDAWASANREGFAAYGAIRGREQQIIDYYGGTGSPYVANAINGISPVNPLHFYYMATSWERFGVYTGGATRK